MSESVSRGVATATVGACGAIATASAKAVHSAVSYITEGMSEASQRDYEYLVSVSSSSNDDTSLSAAEARDEVSRRVAELKHHLAESKYQVTDTRLIPMVALEQSALGRTIDSDDWRALVRCSTHAAFGNAIAKSTKKWADNNYKYLVKSVIEIARNEGFTTPVAQKIGDRRAVISMADTNGRAVIAKLSGKETGVTVDLDLSGFNGDGCHETMDKIIEGLASKGIKLRQAVRRKHFTLKNVKNMRVKSKTATTKKKQISTTDERNRRIDLDRRLRWAKPEKEKGNN